jgi:glycosyltransferase involved in cell wall biosynthesis
VPPGGVDVSVVIPVRDGARSLPPLLESLGRQTLARERFEVIVVDNASRDDTAAIARAAGATVVQEPIPNRSRARNAGIAAASADFIAFTDADCVVDAGWLQAYLACRDSAPLLAGPVEVTTGEPPNAVERFEKLWRFGQEHWVKEGWAATANMAAEKSVLEAIGGFDFTYRHIGEDADLCVRAGRAGHALGWCPGAIVSHEAENERWKMLKRAFFHGYSVNQAHYRLGLGYRAWAHPLGLLSGRRALGAIGSAPQRFEHAEARRMARLAQAVYGMRILGSIWAELRRAR